ncbi:unnamed protein product [Rhodiola kirilowii]
MCLDSSRRLGSSNPTIELFTYKLGKIILSYVFSDVSLRLSTKKLTIVLTIPFKLISLCMAPH